MIGGRKVDWEKNKRDIKKFISSNYQSEDLEGDFGAILAKDRYSILPECVLESESLISVRNFK